MRCIAQIATSYLVDMQILKQGQAALLSDTGYIVTSLRGNALLKTRNAYAAMHGFDVQLGT